MGISLQTQGCGLVYFAQDDLSQLVKIGVTSDRLYTRLQGVKFKFGCNCLSLLGFIKFYTVREAIMEERRLHKMLFARSVGEEWFSLSPQEVYDCVMIHSSPAIEEELLRDLDLI